MSAATPTQTLSPRVPPKYAGSRALLEEARLLPPDPDPTVLLRRTRLHLPALTQEGHLAHLARDAYTLDHGPAAALRRCSYGHAGIDRFTAPHAHNSPTRSSRVHLSVSLAGGLRAGSPDEG